MIHVVLGTKAQLVKMAPLMQELQKRGIPYRFIFTGQHQETMVSLRENFQIKNPDIVLYSGLDITSIPQMFKWLIRIMWQTLFHSKQIFGPERKADSIVLVHGDTFSTLLGAIMGKVAGIKVGHIESGLRSFNLFHPFPEELTRLLTFKLADVYFCPGDWAVQNLKKYHGLKVNTRFNTLLDSLREALKNSDRATVEIPEQPYCVVTMHRFENLYQPEIFRFNLELIEKAAVQLKTIFILHPITEKKLRQYGLFERLSQNPRIELRPRYDYFNFMKLVHCAEFLISDGGSNQEECSYMGKPCILLRKTSERQEGIGENVVVSQYESTVFDQFLAHYRQYATKGLLDDVSPSKIIVDYILQDGTVAVAESL